MTKQNLEEQVRNLKKRATEISDTRIKSEIERKIESFRLGEVESDDKLLVKPYDLHAVIMPKNEIEDHVFIDIDNYIYKKGFFYRVPKDVSLIVHTYKDQVMDVYEDIEPYLTQALPSKRDILGGVGSIFSFMYGIFLSKSASGWSDKADSLDYESFYHYNKDSWISEFVEYGSALKGNELIQICSNNATFDITFGVMSFVAAAGLYAYSQVFNPFKSLKNNLDITQIQIYQNPDLINIADIYYNKYNEFVKSNFSINWTKLTNKSNLLLRAKDDIKKSDNVDYRLLNIYNRIH